MRRREALRSLIALGAATAPALLTRPAAAQNDWPRRPIKLIVPTAAGSILDVFARRVTQHLADRLKQPVVVDNRPGASNTLGVSMGAKAPPDGYTLITGSSSALAIAPALLKLDYDPRKDFEPISAIAQSPFVLVCNPNVPARTAAELVALAKAKPKQLNYATTGNAGTNHVAMAAFAQQAGIELVHVPYKGNAAALVDLIAGQVQMSFDFPGTASAHIKAGKLRALMVTSAKRIAGLPDVPTAAEAGFPGFELYAWGGLLAPKGTPKAVVDRVHRELREVFKYPDVREALERDGSTPTADSPELFRAFIASEQARFGAIIQKAGIQPPE